VVHLNRPTGISPFVMSHLLLRTTEPFLDAQAEVESNPFTRLVLVVEDDADTRELLKFHIESLGYSVVEAADGEEAVRLAERRLPHLVLMDTSMPRVDGLLAAERIRKLDKGGQVTIIFLSGYAHPQFRESALAAGGDGYLVKPISLRELELALKKYLLC
jgi:CheY-like chemotaxis protein